MVFEQVIPLLVGSGFAVYGLNELFAYFGWKRYARKITGVLYAVEKYTAVSTDSDSYEKESIFYRALVKYPWDGQQRLVKGVSANTLNYKGIGQPMDVSVRVDPTTGAVRARIDSGTYLLVSLAFTVMGLLALLVYVFALGGKAWIPLALVSVTVGALRLLQRRGSVQVEHEEDEQTIAESSTLIDTSEALAAEVARNTYVAKLIIAAFFVVACLLLYWGLSTTPESLMVSVKEGQLYQQIVNDNLVDEEKSSLILTAFGAFGLLACFFSMLKTLRQ